MSNSHESWDGCPFRYAVSIIGDKWSLIVIRDVMFHGKQYYGEFLHSPEGISTNILAECLSKLQRKGILSKQRDPNCLSRFIYRLTAKGKALAPVMLAIVAWSSKHDEHTLVSPELASSIEKEPVRLATQLEKEGFLSLDFAQSQVSSDTCP